MRTRHQAGFKTVDLLIVVSVVGILAAIAAPNYVAMRRRAKEASVKANMHTLQVALEDYSIQNESFYPTGTASSLADGRTLRELCPTGNYPVNPYTGRTSAVAFNADPSPGEPGEMAIHPAEVSTYVIKANGSGGDPLPLVLSSGQ